MAEWFEGKVALVIGAGSGIGLATARAFAEERPAYWDGPMWLAGALALNGDLDRARTELAEARRLKPEINSLAQWRAYQPWIATPQYRALREQTLYVGLSRAGFPEQ